MVTNNATNTPQMATKGDIITGQNFPARPVIVPVGTNGTVPVANSSLPAGWGWAFQGAGASVSSFLAFRSTDTGGITGNGTTATIVYDGVSFNTGSNYNNSTGVFTAPVTGVYIFGTSDVPYLVGATSGSTAFTILQILPSVGGAFIVTQAGMAVNRNLDYCNIGASGSVIFPLTAGQTARVQIGWYGLGANSVGIRGLLSGNPRSFFYGALLDQTA